MSFSKSAKNPVLFLGTKNGVDLCNREKREDNIRIFLNASQIMESELIPFKAYQLLLGDLKLKSVFFILLYFIILVWFVWVL